MYGVYGDIIHAAEQAITSFDETEALLEYPEVQADKAYYLSVLAKYNALKAIKDKLSALKSALEEEGEYTALLSGASAQSEREAIYREISLLKRTAAALSCEIADLIGCARIKERLFGRFILSAGSSKFGVDLYGQLKEFMLSRGATIEGERYEFAKGGYTSGITFYIEGEDLYKRLSPLTGAHRVYLAGGKSEELCFALTAASTPLEIAESDVKIDVFHSSGAGGQNVNKVETAVRVTHLPTGIVVTCQDERSQLKNKKRALETLQKRVRDQFEGAEKQRMEADIALQLKRKNTPLSFDKAASTMTDTRLKAFYKAPFPLLDFASYMNGLFTL